MWGPNFFWFFVPNCGRAGPQWLHHHRWLVLKKRMFEHNFFAEVPMLGFYGSPIAKTPQVVPCAMNNCLNLLKSTTASRRRAWSPPFQRWELFLVESSLLVRSCLVFCFWQVPLFALIFCIWTCNLGRKCMKCLCCRNLRHCDVPQAICWLVHGWLITGVAVRIVAGSFT